MFRLNPKPRPQKSGALFFLAVVAWFFVFKVAGPFNEKIRLVPNSIG